MKYTLIYKTGKVSDLQITLAEALPALRARYGNNGRRIIREALDLIAQDVIASTAVPGTPYRQAANPLTMEQLLAICPAVYHEIFHTKRSCGWDEDGFLGELKTDETFFSEQLPFDQQSPAFVANNERWGPFCPHCGIEGDENTLCVSTGCCQGCLDAGL
jgi:hypothetical protein